MSILSVRTFDSNTESVADENTTENSSSASALSVLLLSVFALSVLVVASTGSYPIQALRTVNLKTRTPSKSNPTVQINAEGISPDYDTLVALDYLPWSIVIEPHRDQYLTLSSVLIDGEDMMSTMKEADRASPGDYSFTWSLYNQTYSGFKVKVNIPYVGVLNGTISIYDSTTDATYEDEFTVAIKYIRREIRTLTDADRQEFFDALQLIYSTPFEEGKELYGDKFVNAEFLLYRHLNGAGRSDCDHWHDGA